jgi:phosphoesterase RecJ-like protein
MSKKINELALAIWAEIEKAKRILLHLHVNPDGDSIGSALATYHALKALGKEVTVISGDSGLPRSYAHLPGFSDIKLLDFTQVDLSQFDLFLILDSAAPDRITAKAPVVFPPILRTVVIDHHSTNPKFAQINLVDTSAAATAQILFELFTLWKLPLSAEIASCLFVGLYTDTGGFRFPYTTKATFLAAAELVEKAPEFSRVISKFADNQPRSMFNFERLALNNITTHFSDRLALASLSAPALKAAGLERGDLIGTSSMMASQLKRVEGWDIGVCLVEEVPGYIKISLRSEDGEKWNVAKVLETAGYGGGHPAAAGGVAKNESLDQVKDKLLKIFSQLCPDLK